MMIEQVVLKRRILVIDENDEARKILCEQLSTLGFDVTTADNGISGLSYIRNNQDSVPYHGIFLEMHMQVLGGMAVLQEMIDRVPSMPVIVMADAKHVGRLRQAMKLGAKEYLVKPFDPELVRRKCLSVFHDVQ